MGADLLTRIKNKDITAGVIGMGYVGLPLACSAAAKGFKVLAFDIDPAKANPLYC